ncbi:hypothetical protein PIROE2DRAFT_58936 [Piromyces sp. E2]|nr:hypothetical protein PIROE2DRAFT_58936 [Piromyces sp. E2]|eukprot:OUM67207.1 hypothetical protein PIROE2DRAFT_58936 [Piromyces sp. E2]
MCLNLSKLDFLTSPDYVIENFAYSVEEGTIEESEVKEIFDKIKSKKYTEEEAKKIVKNIILASSIVPEQRTDYQFPSNEALLHVLSFIDIKGSANLKILYSLFPYIIGIEKDEDNNEYCYFNETGPKEIYSEFCDRFYCMSSKDKNLDIAKRIEKIYNKLIEEDSD